MRSFYRTLTFVIAGLVFVQSAMAVWAVSGLSKWVDDGGVFDKSVIESDGEMPFPEIWGIIIHSMNGTFLIPLVGLILLIVSFFAHIPGGVKWAAIIFLLIAIQVTLGYMSHGIPLLGMLHGINALAIVGVSITAGRRVAQVAPASVTTGVAGG
ncbi:hypothetical protein [Longispora albida]|uniref:hypothetical protein n=1 Tax=Longispora albida TaxID=203523 RepID=UPI00035F953C|nr:hypothetical protein [Longispora albida]